MTTVLDGDGAQTGPDVPRCISVGEGLEIFTAAWRSGLPVMLKGPTGCGKTRLVEHAAALLGVPLYTVCCHEDMTASDFTGAFRAQGFRHRMGGRTAHPRSPGRRNLLSRRSCRGQAGRCRVGAFGGRSPQGTQ
jgi:hypothetical protein